MFRSDESERLFLGNFARLVNAVEKLTVRPVGQEPVPTKTFDDIKRLYRDGEKIQAI